MTSLRCPECNLTNWATAINCKRCGYFLNPPENAQAVENPFDEQNFAADSAQNAEPNGRNQPNYHYAQQNPPADQSNFQRSNYRQANNQYGQPNYYQSNYGQPPQLKSGMAIASMVLGIVGCFLAAPVGLILGIVSLRRANNRPFEYGGKGFAIAGIVLNSLGFLMIPVIAAIAIPNLLAARRAANEASAIATIRTISAAEDAFRSTANGRCGDLKQLQATNANDPSAASGQKNGYRFMVTNLPSADGGCEIRATPVSASSGNRSFYYSTEDATIRAANKHGEFADRSDAPLGQGNSFSAQPASAFTSAFEAADEARTIANLRTLVSAEITYAATSGAGKCGNLQSLAAAQLISREMGGGQKNGYRLQVSSLTQSGCEIRATPISATGGNRSFYADLDGVVHGAKKSGTLADKSDPPIN